MCNNEAMNASPPIIDWNFSSSENNIDVWYLIGRENPSLGSCWRVFERVQDLMIRFFLNTLKINLLIELVKNAYLTI